MTRRLSEDRVVGDEEAIVATTRRLPAGIRLRHARACRSVGGGRCSCSPGYQVRVWSARDGRDVVKSFPTLAAAKSWQQDTASQIRTGRFRAPTATTVRAAADELLAGMESGAIRNRSGDVYRPSVLRSYQTALKLHILPVLGDRTLSSVERRDVQSIADRMLAARSEASTIRNALMPLRVIYRRAVDEGAVAASPCERVRLPAVRGRRDRIASTAESVVLLAALPARIRPIYATALYAGLRRGELRALTWDDVDFGAGVIRVRASLDDSGDRLPPKTFAGERSVPIVSALRAVLVEHRVASGGRRYVFPGGSRDRPFTSSTVAREARETWAAARLATIGLHEARHTFASILIAAGVNAKAISTAMGHSSIQITFDRYGKLMPGSEAELVERVDAYLSVASDRV
jgi:integrase